MTHPTVLSALAWAGHGSLVLIADAHFAAATALGANTVTVHTALAPDSPLVPDIARLVAATIAVEEVTTMAVPAQNYARVGLEALAAVRAFPAATPVPHSTATREEFFARCGSPDLALCLVSGDRRRFANVLLRVGVTDPEPA
ncbi:hypothetical protein BJH93_13630 [Kocuria polaris]|nr:hypothetical protein [Kocuria polaris]